MNLKWVQVADAINIQSNRYVDGGSDDYSRDVTNIISIVDATGRTHTPVWGDAWTSLAPGIQTAHLDGRNHARIAATACPVLVHFKDVFEYVSYGDSAYNERTTDLRWTAYVRPGASPWISIVLRFRCGLAEWRGWSPGKAFRRWLIDLRRE